MCGIAGFYNGVKSKVEAQNTILKMLDSIAYRGPDDFGIYQDGFLTLGHRRLSIQDLTNAGNQPMQSFDGRYVIVFNGEIYNFKELRKELSLDNWRGHSDTEVMLAAFSIWGVSKALEKFNGMFAFALWDKKNQTLTLGRDRFGEKPLYYYHQDGIFSFASEIKALEKDKDLILHIDRRSITHQLETSYIPAPLSIYDGINKVAPGNIVVFSYKTGVLTTPFWELSSQISACKKNMFTCEKEAIEALESELKKAVRLRMTSDVPLGGFLSGGIDSSLVLALMQSQSNEPVNSFSIGFDVPGYNEAVYAKDVATYLGTNHHEKYLSSNDAIAIVSKLGSMFDEPFSDVSQIPTYLVSAMAKEHVTVCLSGDGGDELFAGYKRYYAIPELWSKINRVPFRPIGERLINNLTADTLSKLFFFLKPYAEKYGRSSDVGTKIKKFSDWLSAQDFEDLYAISMKHWKNADSLVIGGEHENIWSPKAKQLDSKLEKMMYQDSISYLPGDILTKVDRASMFVSLESRIPFLDPGVAEVAWRIPTEMKYKNGSEKWILKQILYKYLPQKIMDRPKMGFSVPISQWLKDDLKEWACDLLSEDYLIKQRLFDHELVGHKLKKHLIGEEDNGSLLWDVLMVQAWLDADPARKARL